jgi:hypothetical protein
MSTLGVGRRCSDMTSLWKIDYYTKIQSSLLLNNFLIYSETLVTDLKAVLAPFLRIQPSSPLPAFGGVFISKSMAEVDLTFATSYFFVPGPSYKTRTIYRHFSLYSLANCRPDINTTKAREQWGPTTRKTMSVPSSEGKSNEVTDGNRCLHVHISDQSEKRSFLRLFISSSLLAHATISPSRLILMDKI